MFKTILVPVRGDSGDKASLGTALAVATLFGGHIDVAHIQGKVPSLVPTTGPSSAHLISELQFASALQESGRDRRYHARRLYRQFCTDAKIERAADHKSAKGCVSVDWTDYEGYDVEEIIRLAHRHDLVVLHAAPAGNAGFSPDEAGEIILSRSGPVMLAPSRAPCKIARTVAIAWKNTPEAASALAASMPLLHQADKIFVISVGDRGLRSDPSVDDVVVRLRWHGLNAIADPIEAEQTLPAARLMVHVQSLGADLLVMGAYGHNRMRELILGSFTKQVLSGASVPVFLTH